jgi:hypothetical protein
MEDCLYYDLSAQADRLQGKAQSLSTLPPTRYGKQTDRVVVDVLKTSIRQLWNVSVFMDFSRVLCPKILFQNEIWKEMHINGYMQVAWTDWRMKWDKDKYPGMDSIKINDYGHLWMPDVYSQRYTHTFEFVLASP